MIISLITAALVATVKLLRVLFPSTKAVSMLNVVEVAVYFTTLGIYIGKILG